MIGERATFVVLIPLYLVPTSPSATIHHPQICIDVDVHDARVSYLLSFLSHHFCPMSHIGFDVLHLKGTCTSVAYIPPSVLICQSHPLPSSPY